MSLRFALIPTAIGLLLLPTAPLSAQNQAPATAPVARIEKQPVDSPQRLDLLKVQIALDQANFRPGKIDGLGGEFTQAAADRFNTARGNDPGTLIDISAITEPLIDYTLTEEDLEWVGKLASTPAEQEKLKRMPYADAWELVAEKFHCDIKYLRELNPDVTNPAADTVFRVPNVEPFSMQAVVELEKSRLAEAKAKKADDEAAKANPSPSPESTPATDADPNPESEIENQKSIASIVILREPRLIELYENDQIIASFPCTPGSDRVPVPVGTWKITSNVLMPYFRYDKSVLDDGTRSENAFNIPPGPNNYVGIVWMGINRKSVGIHGTQYPDQIGRNQSSGCIRLSNWDAFFLTQKIGKGTPVVVR